MVALTVATSLVLAASQLAAGLVAAPDQRRAGETCTVKTQRKPWQNLTAAEKAGYIKSTLCLINSPSKTGLPAAKTRWDDLQYIHVLNTPYVHGTGAFLPFHRYFITVHERILRTECGYDGSMPYWTEPLDVDSFVKSPLFDPVTAFGGNGTGSDHCVRDGPFANLTLRVRTDLQSSEYCLSRNFNPCMFKGAAQSIVDGCMAMPTYETMWHCIEGQPHGSGHGGINALMQDVNLSPGDPIFYLHHTYLDKLWWDWQSKNLTHRLTEVGGNNMPMGFGFGFGGGAFPGANGTGWPSFPFGGAGGGNGSAKPGPPAGGAGAAPGTNGSSNPWAAFGGAGAPGNASAIPGFNLTGAFDPSCMGAFAFPFGGGNASNFSMPAMPVMKPNKAISDYFNDGGNVTTLSHTLFSAGVVHNVTVGDVMDIRSGFVCAEYS